MKNLFFIPILCLFSLLTIHNYIFTAQRESIPHLQEQYFQLRQVRDETFLLEVKQAHRNLQANPNSKDFQEDFNLYNARLNSCNDAMLKLRKKAFPQEIIIVPTQK